MRKSIIICCITTLLFASCKKSDYITVIPADANMVASIDMMKFTTESDLLDSKLFDEACRILRINPLDMGIDFIQPLYIFHIGNEYTGITASISSTEDLEECLTKYSKDKIATKPKKNGGLSWSKLFGEIEVAYDDATLLLMYKHGNSGISTKQMIKSLFLMEEENSFISTTHYARMNDLGNNDILIYTNASVLSQDEQNQLLTLLPDNTKAKDMCSISRLDAGNGDLVLSSQIYSDKPRLQQFINDEFASLKKLSGICMDKAPNNALVTLMLGIDGKKLHSLIKEIPNISRQLSLASFALDEDIETLLDNTNGDVMICTDYDGNVMTNINGEQKNNLSSPHVNWGKKRTSELIDTDELNQYCLFCYVDFNNMNIHQYTKLIPVPSIYKCVNSLTGVEVYSKGEGDITIKLESSNKENIFKQLLQ